jgi:Glutathionylspermidine synthase preATP-grasp
VNSDVCGGFTEASCFAEVMAKATGRGAVAGDPGAAWADAIAAGMPAGAMVVLLSAPGWVEDAQVVAHLAARLRARGLDAELASPHHLRWTSGRARLRSDFRHAPVHAILRFYQVAWIVDLPCRDAWMPLFRGGRTPVSNPSCAALTETKRLPLVWSELDASTVAWRRAMPEARDPCDPRAARGLWSGDWVLKPAFGNTGDHVALRAGMSRRAWAGRVAAALAQPRRWVAQRRFESIPVPSPQGPLHACVGVYVVDGQVAGAYGRLSPSPVIDHAAIDTAVLVETRGARGS